MMKRLITFVALLALASGAYATDPDHATGTAGWVVAPSGTNCFAIYHATVTDSNLLSVADTSAYFTLNPWQDLGGNYPSAIVLYGVITEADVAGITRGDSLILNIDVNPLIGDSTKMAKASSYWNLISGTSGSATYASRTGKSDTLTNGLRAGNTGATTYSFTSSQLATCMPEGRLRWSYGGAGSANDTVCVDWYIIYSRTKY